jgi:hypothetical protein
VIATEINIRTEIARVQGEIVLFRERCLPAFFGDPVHEVFDEDYAEWVREKIVTRAGSLSKWQGTTSQLAELLPLGPLPANSLKICRDDFKEFLFQEATPSFCFRERRIVWKIRLFVDPSFCVPYCPTFPSSAFENLPEVRQWLMSLPVDSPELANAFCMALPFIADSDSVFPKLALDPETWRNVVLTDRDITEEERLKRLKWIDGQVFCHWLNNSLVHVLGSLANNQFMLIEDLLDHPNLVGGYTHLMPHYLFAVLFEKVATLRGLSEERPELW